MSEPARYDPVAQAFHWLTALAVIGLVAIGMVMTELPPGSSLQFRLFQWHKSVGITVLAVTLLRVAWRLAHRPPSLPAGMPGWEAMAARATHAVLYSLLLVLPLEGWAVVSASPLHIPTVLYGVLSWPDLPGLGALSGKPAIEAALKTLHDILGWSFAALLVLHVTAALRHHLILRDDVLRRMLPRRRRVRVHLYSAFLAVAIVPALPSHSARAAEWAVDMGHSTLGFTGSQGGSPFSGHFTRWQAEIAFDPANPAGGHARVVVDMTSATTGDSQKDQALPQPDWFDVKEFPQAEFVAAAFRPKGGNAYEAVGTLTIRGVRQDVVLPFTLDLDGDHAHAAGRLPLLRTDYGVGQGAWSTGQMVGLEVAATLDLTATRRP